MRWLNMPYKRNDLIFNLAKGTSYGAKEGRIQWEPKASWKISAIKVRVTGLPQEKRKIIRKQPTTNLKKLEKEEKDSLKSAEGNSKN